MSYMSFCHTRIMLDTLQKFSNSNVTLTLKKPDQTPLLSVCYHNNLYVITYLDSLITETHDCIESTFSALERAYNTLLQTSS